MHNHGIRDIYIQDDTFVMNRDNVMGFCKILLDKKLDLTWSCHGRVDHIDKELLQTMKRSRLLADCPGNRKRVSEDIEQH